MGFGEFNLCEGNSYQAMETVEAVEAMNDSTVEDLPKQSSWPIYLYIPNLIGKKFFKSDPRFCIGSAQI